jgi:hypothetical protein
MNEIEIDWADAGAKFSAITADLMHRDGAGLHGSAFYAEALRRLWSRIGHQWVTNDHMMRVLAMNRATDRANGEAAEASLRHHTAQFERTLIGVRGVLAAALRARCNERTVPSRYRRDGVELAASWLDGGFGLADAHRGEMVGNVRAAWDESFTRPAEPGLDYRQAEVAVDAVLATLASVPAATGALTSPPDEVTTP